MDATTHHQQNLTGFGFIVRDHAGSQHATQMWKNQGNMEACLAEAIALRAALLWVHENNLQQVLVETDS